MSTPQPIMELDAVEKRYGGAVALECIDLEIAKREFIVLMGPSGCGKTTTLRILAGLETPSAGRVRMWGREINDLPPWKRDTPLVWQNYALFPFLNVVRNVEFGLKQRGGMTRIERRRKAMEWLDRLGIAEHAERGVDQLSGGQRQRVALARSLALEPEVLLLDEPLSALDPHLRIRMQSELARLHADLGITFVYVTHAQSEAVALADRIVIMNRGKVQQIGSPTDIYRTPANRFVAEFMGGTNVVAGTVAAASGERIEIENGNGRFATRAGGRPRRVGEEAAFIVRADWIDVAPAEDDSVADSTSAVGQLATEDVIGAIVSLFVDLPDGSQFLVQKQQHEMSRLGLARGDRVRLSWSIDNTYLLTD